MLDQLRLLRQVVREQRARNFERQELAARFPGAAIAPTALVRAFAPAFVSLGEGVTVGDWTLLLAIDDPHATSAPSSLTIGAGTTLGEFCNLRGAGGQIRIGRKVMISQAVHVIAANHAVSSTDDLVDQPWESVRTGVDIADNVWIGCQTVILPGVSVGEGAVVAAGAVVNADVAPFTTVGGVPARVLNGRGRQ